MTMVRTTDFYWPKPLINATAAPAFGTTTMNATGQRHAFIGRHWNNAGISKNIRNVGFVFGAGVVKAGGSALTVSLQDVDAATGIPVQPDGTQDQTVAIANADAAFASNTFITTGNLSADRTTAFGALLAVVVEFDGAGRLGADVVPISYANSYITDNQNANSNRSSGGVWTFSGQSPAVLLKYDDGTYGSLLNGNPFSAGTSFALNTGTTPDEAGLEFQVPFDCSTDGAKIGFTSAAGASFDVVLYDAANTVLATVSINEKQLGANSNRFIQVLWGDIALTKNTTYRCVVKPTTATSLTLHEYQFNLAAHLAAVPGGTACYSCSRTDAGAWTQSTTKRPAVYMSISKIDDGAGAGTGGNIAARNQLGM